MPPAEGRWDGTVCQSTSEHTAQVVFGSAVYPNLPLRCVPGPAVAPKAAVLASGQLLDAIPELAGCGEWDGPNEK